MRINSKERSLFNIIGYFLITLASLICIIPFVMVISGSLTDEQSIFIDGYRLFPKVFSVESYLMIFKFPDQVAHAYLVTLTLTVCGSLLGLFLTAMTAFSLQKPGFKYRNVFALYFYFTTLFSGGLVPWYILMVRYLRLKDSYLALLLPLLFSVFDIIVMRSFMKSVPDAMAESAKIDGAGDFSIFIRIYLPLSKPAIATIGLFIALRYWNDWYNALLFIENEKLFSLQFYLYKTLSSMENAKRFIAQSGLVLRDFPSESFKLAMTVVATGPIILLYPFVQKYFIKGLMIGAVKG